MIPPDAISCPPPEPPTNFVEVKKAIDKFTPFFIRFKEQRPETFTSSSFVSLKQIITLELHL